MTTNELVEKAYSCWSLQELKTLRIAVGLSKATMSKDEWNEVQKAISNQAMALTDDVMPYAEE